MTHRMIKNALISLTDKTDAAVLAKALTKHGVRIFSTGGTAALLRENGVEVADVADITGFPEILDGRVKTLHPKIYGGILGLRDNETHLSQMESHGIEGIDLIVVNLYAFSKKTAESGVTIGDAMANVDIGGPCMIRAAAKNHQFTTVLTDPKDYKKFMEELELNNGCVSEKTRLRLAVKAFDLTASYDANISTWLRRQKDKEAFPIRFSYPTAKKTKLRYGENPHQKACFYSGVNVTEPCIASAKLLGGKKLSYNNILDTDAACELVKEFDEPAAVLLKHTNPCGAATAHTIMEAFQNAYLGDTVSAFGGICALNRPVDEALAEQIASPDKFLEVLIAPECSEQAIELIRKKVKWGKNLRILSTGPMKPLEDQDAALSFRAVTGGVLVQNRDVGFGREERRVVTEKEPDKAELAALDFAWKVVKHVKSNAIVLAKDCSVVGVGAGQMSRIDSANIAGSKAGDKAKGSFMSSDAFFPFRDCVDLAAKLGVKAIIQPGGSVRDQESIDAANEHGIVMVFTGNRHFRH